MIRIYTALFANAVLLAGVVLFQVWSDGEIAGDLFFRLIGTGVIMGVFLSFTALLRMDFANLESRALGWAILALAFAVQAMALLAVWDLWVPNALFWKLIGTFGVLIALALYILNLKEDLLRESRQKKDNYLD